MQTQSIRKLAFLTGMAGFAVMLISASARADLNLTFQETAGANPAGPFTQLNSGSPAGNGFTISYGPPTNPNPISFGDFQVKSYNISEQDGNIFGPSQSNTSSINLINTSASAATIVVTIDATKFNTPSPPMIMSNQLNTQVLQIGNLVNGTSPSTISFTSTVGGVTSAPLSTDLTITGNQQAPMSGTQNTFVPSVPNPSNFDISETITLTLAGHANVNIDVSTLLTPAPEPGTIAMALTVLPLFGLGAWVRRRRTRA